MKITTKQHHRYWLNNFSLVLLTIFFFFIFSTLAFADKDPSKSKKPIKDIRILIDISGSMKKTDPNNLRQPALRLFANLMTEEVFAGVWTFGKWVNMLIPHAIADKQWKSVAQEKSGEINSLGLYTNIEDAIKRATWDWKDNDPDYERNLIILSDGMIDISNDSTEDELSRSRILNEILTRLKNAKVKIHTIALSESSDRSLLRQLSSATKGIHETINTTSDLDKVFLKILDAASPREELPLIDNKVKVDDTIKEITFLIFRKNNDTKTKIISPSKISFTTENDGKNITWHSENRYDLVTVDNPEPGIWKIESDVLPDNRVMVVTNLRYIPTRLPNIALVNQSIPIHAHLETENKIINERKFLQFVRMNVKYRSKGNNKERSIKLKDNGIGDDKNKKDGVFSGKIKKIRQAGEYTFEFFANGTTFKRQITQQINIVENPVSYDVSLTNSNDVVISIIPYQSLIDINSTKISIKHTPPDNKAETYDVKKTSTVEWKRTIPTNNVVGKHNFSIIISAVDSYGKTINQTIKIDEITINNIETNDKLEEKLSVENSNNPDTPNPDDNESWLSITLIVFLFNLLLFSLLFSAFKYHKKILSKLLPHPYEGSGNG